MTDQVDILIVNALRMELEAVETALRDLAVELTPREDPAGLPFLLGTLSARDGPLRLALARPTRMGAVPVTATATSLVTQLRPTCLAMSGVCAGNPADVALGDVIIAEMAYAYDEGKRSADRFEGDHRQIPLTDRWQRHAQELPVDGLACHGVPDMADRRNWLLECLAAKVDPARHPARERYLGGALWENVVRTLEAERLILREGTSFLLTDDGLDAVAVRRAYSGAPIGTLPIAVHVGPIASGNAVVKDGVTWESLKIQGVRTVLGLEMEAAAIAQVAHRLEVPRWIVAKGAMDHADPNKEDRFKPFAAAASAQVLLRFLQSAPMPGAHSPAQRGDAGISNSNVVGDITGSYITVVQSVTIPDP